MIFKNPSDMFDVVEILKDMLELLLLEYDYNETSILLIKLMSMCHYVTRLSCLFMECMTE